MAPEASGPTASGLLPGSEAIPTQPGAPRGFAQAAHRGYSWRLSSRRLTAAAGPTPLAPAAIASGERGVTLESRAQSTGSGASSDCRARRSHGAAARVGAAFSISPGWRR